MNHSTPCGKQTARRILRNRSVPLFVPTERGPGDVVICSFGRPYGQPALTLRAKPATRLGASRFDQAQG